MASIAHLPPEVLLQVIASLGGPHHKDSLAALDATNRRHYAYANPVLYDLEARDEHSYTLYAAAQSGAARTLQQLIDAGVDVGRPWYYILSRLRLEAGRFRRRVFTGEYASEAELPVLRRRRRLFRYLKRTSPSARRDCPLEGADWVNWFDDASLDDDDDCELEVGVVEGPPACCCFTKRADMYVVDPRNATIYWTALHAAALGGDERTVELLIANGADVNASSDGFCECGNVSFGVWADDVYGPNRTGGMGAVRVEDLWAEEEGRRPTMAPATPLLIAICHGHESVARLLLRRGASPFLEVSSPTGPGFDDNTGTGAHSSSSREAQREPASGVRGRWKGVTALHLASHRGFGTLVRHLLEDGYQSEVDVEDDIGQTPLAYLFGAGNFDDVVPYLLSRGANINVDLGGGATTLLEACWHGRYDDAVN
ncbi:Uu.00g047920.m01.CDS01 [Anthostomella pinea]|uniref:Uu.00g047920.m01.CDS01 n=1 Tax=Anthostomella pinea TaxID=933095 RepID=A0AAI8VBI3_9PEZI|nr:Uu.00g047920.m01.CDS01 [Anthostomella pinea]